MQMVNLVMMPLYLPSANLDCTKLPLDGLTDKHCHDIIENIRSLF